MKVCGNCSFSETNQVGNLVCIKQKKVVEFREAYCNDWSDKSVKLFTKRPNNLKLKILSEFEGAPVAFYEDDEGELYISLYDYIRAVPGDYEYVIKTFDLDPKQTFLPVQAIIDWDYSLNNV